MKRERKLKSVYVVTYHNSNYCDEGDKVFGVYVTKKSAISAIKKDSNDVHEMGGSYDYYEGDFAYTNDEGDGGDYYNVFKREIEH